MSLVKLYEHEAPNAPTLTAEKGAFIALLKACLVEGFGTKTAAGWSVLHEDVLGYRIALKMGGNGRILQIDDSHVNYAKIRLYTSMSDIETGENKTPFDTNIYIYKRLLSSLDTADTTPREWLITATDSFFYYHVKAKPLESIEYSTSHSLAFAGDFEKIDERTVNNTGIFGYKLTTSYSRDSLQIAKGVNAQDDNCYIVGNHDVIAPLKVGFHYADRVGNDIGGIGEYDGVLLITTPISIHENDNLHGYLPAAIAPRHDTPRPHWFKEMLSGEQYISIRTVGGQYMLRYDVDE